MHVLQKLVDESGIKQVTGGMLNATHIRGDWQPSVERFGTRKSSSQMDIKATVSQRKP